MHRLLASFCFSLALALSPAVRAADIDTVRAFYTDILSDTGSAELGARIERVIAPDWVNTPAPRGKLPTHRENFVGAMGYLSKTIPDLKWEITEILRDGDRYIVRGEGTGTPARKFLGIEPNGNSFRIMSIDIHTVRDGKIVRTFHVEPWHAAMRQLRGE